VHHKVTIRDSAIVAAATLSHRYITDRFLPDKAIDLIDEAASRLRIELTSMPQEIDELTRRLTQLQIEEQALQKENEKGVITQINDVKKKIEDEREAANRAEREGDLNRAAELRYGSIPQMQRE